MYGIQMKDVAKKLRNWKTQNVNGVKINDLIQMQKQLQRFYIKKNNGDDKKIFIDVDNIGSLTPQRKIQITKQNILRIFDEISECLAWEAEYINNSSDQQIKYIDQNLLFQLIDIAHFIFNIVSVWKLQNQIKFDYQTINDGKQRFPFVKDNISNLQIITSIILSSISWKSWKRQQETDYIKLSVGINKMLQQIIYIFNILGYKKEDIYKMYISKNKQNKQRQLKTQGYK